jgi:hypothetical protein
VESPEVNHDEPVDITGDRVRIRFTEPMARPGPASAKGPVDAAPGTLTITPAKSAEGVPGKTRWLDPYTLEFASDKPLALGERYAVSLGDVKSQAGVGLSAPWRMTAIARVAVAGKVLAYTPKLGQPRLVAMHPFDGSTVGTRPEIAVLYDQPVDLPRAQKLLRIRAHGIREKTAETDVPFTAVHPPGPTFQGIPVDRRFVVVLQPA